MTIAFIGLGAMGWPMAGHLNDAGHDLLLYTRRDDAMAHLAQRGQVTRGLGKCAQAEIIILNVTGTDDVLGLVRELAQTLKPGNLVIDHSTIDPAGARVAAGLIRDAGGEFVDAPVSGGEKGAIAGNLVSMVGGQADAVARAASIFSAYVQSHQHMGEAGAGQVAKLCNQIAQVINIQGICEAMRFADQHGVDKGQVLTAIQGGMAASAMLDLMGPKIASGDFSAGIQSRLHAKDLNIAQDSAGENSPALRATVAQLNALMDAGMGMDDTSSLYRLLGEDHG